MAITAFEQVFMRTAQEYLPLFVTGVSTLADFNFDSTIKRQGDSVTFPRLNYESISVLNVTNREDTFTPQYATSVSEKLEVNKEKFIAFNLPAGDVIQASYFDQAAMSGRIVRRVAETLDTSIMGSIHDMAYQFDNGELVSGVSDNVPISVSTTNAVAIPAEMKALLTEKNVPAAGMIMIMDSRSMSKYDQNLANRAADTAIAYSVNGSPVRARVRSVDSGYAGEIQGSSAYVSNNLPSVTELTFSAQPTNGQTLTYRGVVVTFVSSLTAPNQVLIGTDFDATAANLAAFFNDQAIVNAPVSTAVHTGLDDVAPAMTGSGNTDPQSDFQKIQRLEIAVSYNATSNVMTIKTNGGGKARVTETATGIAITNNYILGYFGKGKTVKVAMQTPTTGTMRFLEVLPNTPQSQIQVHALYGVLATYESRIQGLKMLIDARNV